jgi:hypothetical protein
MSPFLKDSRKGFFVEERMKYSIVVLSLLFFGCSTIKELTKPSYDFDYELLPKKEQDYFEAHQDWFDEEVWIKWGNMRDPSKRKAFINEKVEGLHKIRKERLRLRKKYRCEKNTPFIMLRPKYSKSPRYKDRLVSMEFKFFQEVVQEESLSLIDDVANNLTTDTDKEREDRISFKLVNQSSYSSFSYFSHTSFEL